METSDFGGEIRWWPTRDLIEHSQLTRFMRAHQIGSLDELHRRSTDDIAWFWNAVLKELDVRFDPPYTQVVDLSPGIQMPRWCVGGGMNIVDNLLGKWRGTQVDQRAAVKWETEDGASGAFTFAQLRTEVERMAGGLRSLGLGSGDVIGVFMPMTAECVIAMLAVIKIGAIFLPLFSGYGAAAVASRLADAQTKALFTCDGVQRRGKVVPMKPVADEAAALVPSVRHLIVHQKQSCQVSWNPSTDHWWHDVMQASSDGSSARTSADEPMMLIYTSGTTGKPKGAVHTHCGFPIKAAQDMRHCMDLHDDESLFWLTDIGWMMGPWLVFGTLLNGAAMVVYDGSPDWPAPDRLWALCARHEVTMLGISPTLVRSLLRHGEGPLKAHDLSKLRKFGSTGEPWNPVPWNWLFDVVGGGRLPILNYSGGTEISGGILCGNVHSPLKPGSFAGPVPGMDADVVDIEGRSVRGEVGQLVIRKPWIGMTRGFWKDPQRYLDTYWSTIPNVWVHGDWAAVDSDGLWYILGRSDDTIKVAGKRLGPSEVESVLVAHPAVSESAAIGVPDELKGQALVCFCVLKDDTARSDALKAELAACIVRELGKPLAPKAIVFLRELPKTRNGKIMRRVARAAYLGENCGDLTALENPASLQELALAQSR